METLADFGSVLSVLCLAKNKFGIYVSHSHPELGPVDIGRAIPCLEGDDLLDFWHRGWAYLLFDTYEQMQASYLTIVGDENYTNDFDHRVYACTCDSAGNCLTENT